MDLEDFPVPALCGIKSTVDCRWDGDNRPNRWIEVWVVSLDGDHWEELPIAVVNEMRRSDCDGSVYRVYANEDPEVTAERIRQELNSAARRVKGRPST